MAKNYVGFRKWLAEEVYEFGYNADTPECPKCGATMEFHGGSLPIGEGYWDCPGCNFTVKEEELNKYDPFC